MEKDINLDSWGSCISFHCFPESGLLLGSKGLNKILFEHYVH